ncbi:hypothetical protein [Thorsellia kenyensis]|uniref:Uncharacterized protein n=1 Tax=Thorsellia kenyensis TaxID=1549888 RepID=A0ABV6CCB3_9GAMM
MKKITCLLFLIVFLGSLNVNAKNDEIKSCGLNTNFKPDNELLTMDGFKIKQITQEEYDAAEPLPSWFEVVDVQGEQNGTFEVPLENGEKLVFNNINVGTDSDYAHFLVGMFSELDAYLFELSLMETSDFRLYSKLDGELIAVLPGPTLKHPKLPLFFSFATVEFFSGTYVSVFKLDESKKLKQIYENAFGLSLVAYGYGDDRAYPAEYNATIKFTSYREEKNPARNPTLFIDKSGIIYLTVHPIKRKKREATEYNPEEEEHEVQLKEKCYLSIELQS